MAKLTGPQRKQLVDALADAFPSRAALAQLVDFGLSERLDRIAGLGTLQDAAFDLVRWAEARGRLAELVDAAAGENPDNPALRAFVEGSWAPLAADAAPSRVASSPAPPAARRAVVLTALDVEYRAVRVLLADLREEVHPRGTVYERGRFAGRARSWDVGLVQVGKGNDRAAFEAERAVAYFAPDVALFVGVAGGLKDVALGDVVAATKVYGYESGKDADEFRPRPEIGQSSYPLIQRAQAVARAGRWLERIADEAGDVPSLDVLVAPIAAGAKVVAGTESATAELLRRTYGDAVAVEMEGSGFLAAAHASREVQALVVRGISDLVDGKTEADAAGWQARAARHAAAFAIDVLDGLDPAPGG